MSNHAASDVIAAATVAAAAAADAIDGRRCCCSCCRCCRGCNRCDYLRYLRVARNESYYCAAATAAEAQVPPAADGAGFPYHHLLRAVLCHIGKKYFRLTQFEVDCLLVKLSVEFINLAWEQRFHILKRVVDRSLNCHVICLNF